MSTDSLDSDNPFQSPPLAGEAEDGPPPVPLEIRIESELTRRDINSAARKPWVLLLLVLVTIPPTLWCVFWLTVVLLVSTGIATNQSETDWFGFWLFFTPVLVINLGLLLLIRRQIFPSIQFLKSYPRAMRKRTGLLTNDSIFLYDEECSTWMPLSALTGYHRKGRFCILKFDSLGVATQVFAANDFSDPVLARQIFTHHENSLPGAKLKTIVDQRKLAPPGPCMLNNPIRDDSLLFAGPISTDHLKHTPIQRIRSRILALWTIIGALLLLPGITMWLLSPQRSFVFLAMLLAPLLVLYWWFYSAYLKRIRAYGEQGVTLSVKKGSLNNDSVTIMTAIDQITAKWSFFESGSSNEHVIWLRIPGAFKAFEVLPMTLFADEAEFESARQIVARVFPG